MSYLEVENSTLAAANITTWVTRAATEADWPQISELLSETALPLDGAYEQLSHFRLAVEKTNPASIGAVAGIEPYGTVGLLRSVAVRPQLQGSGLGRFMVTDLIQKARAYGLTELILLTLSAASFFTRLGFKEIKREDLAGSAVLASVEFDSVCPASATHMRLDLASVQIPKEDNPTIQVRLATLQDIPAITTIYNQGIEDNCTFETELRSVEERQEWFLARGNRHLVLVAVETATGRITGWASLNPFNARPVYRFVADISVYIEREQRYKRIGELLLKELIRQAKLLGYHKLALATFPHSAGVKLYARCGFRTVGDYQEQGILLGKWTDTRIMELLLPED